MTPETNRLEVMGDKGKVVIEDGKLTFDRLRVPERQFNEEYSGGAIAKLSAGDVISPFLLVKEDSMSK